MTVHTCAGCSTQYALDLTACPHCGSTEREVGGAGSGRLPLFITVACAPCGRRWNLRLGRPQPGLVEIPSLFCASCGGQVQVPWPLVEEDMSPKITAHGGPTNARDSGTSPVALASTPLAGAEAGQGHSTSETVVPEESVSEMVGHATPADGSESPEISGDGSGESLDEIQSETGKEEAVEYDSMTLAELKAAADERGVAAYGTKAQIAERLREADQED